MTTIRPEITRRAPGDVLERVGGAALLEPLAVTFKAASKITGLGLTTLWKYGKEKRIRLIRLAGTRRTLIDYSSLKKLLLPETSGSAAAPPSRPPEKIGGV